MSDLSEIIEEDRAGRRAKRTARMTRKARYAARKRPSEPGGVILPCGCRWIYSGGAWRHVTPCKADMLRDKPVGDEEMLVLLGAAA